MQEIREQEFEKSDVILDGHIYRACSFRSCTLIYSGTAPFQLFDNKISSDTKLEFTGVAADTLRALSVFYTSFGQWGKDRVIGALKGFGPDTGPGN